MKTLDAFRHLLAERNAHQSGSPWPEAPFRSRRVIVCAADIFRLDRHIERAAIWSCRLLYDNGCNPSHE
ncbi:hypothetical protein [Mesorhizobium waimense]|nr:hypothetical protein [Mesorhizobium waimense]